MIDAAINMTEVELAMRKLANQVKLDTIEACVRRAERAWPPAHTYASENADIYRAQDHAARTIVKAIRELAGTPPITTGKREDVT
jgi:TolB-like protein